jgi:hypothetical protein
MTSPNEFFVTTGPVLNDGELRDDFRIAVEVRLGGEVDQQWTSLIGILLIKA